MPRYAKKLGQVGDYWLSKRPNSPAWCRTWFDRGSDQVRRSSLGTEDFEEARIRLAAWFIENHRTKDAAPSEALLSAALNAYLARHERPWPSEEQAEIAVARFIAFWPARAVSVLTLDEQARYVKERRAAGLSDGTISRELSVLRAALRDAVKRQELASCPWVKEIETTEAKRSREPKGRPISTKEAAALFRAAGHSERRLMLLVILFGTLCRPDAARDLTPFQHDVEHRILALNPRGRRQTKKWRPTIPVCETLEPWLGLRTRSHYVGHLSGPVGSIRTMWREIRKDAGLDAEVIPYSVRHTVARELRKRRVPTEQIELMLGHRRPAHGTTGIYAPYDPDYCRDAVAAIDSYFDAIEAELGAGYFLKAFERVKAGAERFAERRAGSRGRVVGATGIEPVTPTMSTRRAKA